MGEVGRQLSVGLVNQRKVFYQGSLICKEKGMDFRYPM